MDIVLNTIAEANAEKLLAYEDFYYWYGQSKEQLTFFKNSFSRRNSYPAQYYLQVATEYILNAVLDSIAGCVIKTDDPHILWMNVLPIIPEIEPIFPQNSVTERKLFHYMNPYLLQQTEIGYSIPNEAELIILSCRIEQLQIVVKSICINILNSYSKTCTYE
jgi:hypothetical protein